MNGKCISNTPFQGLWVKEPRLPGRCPGLELNRAFGAPNRLRLGSRRHSNAGLSGRGKELPGKFRARSWLGKSVFLTPTGCLNLSPRATPWEDCPAHGKQALKGRLNLSPIITKSFRDILSISQDAKMRIAAPAHRKHESSDCP